MNSNNISRGGRNLLVELSGSKDGNCLPDRVVFSSHCSGANCTSATLYPENGMIPSTGKDCNSANCTSAWHSTIFGININRTEARSMRVL